MPIVPGRLIAQKYRLEAPLARGGMGAIWVARHVSLGSQVAVKFLDPKLAASPAFVIRFEREARAAASIQSPHVVQVHDFGVDNGVPYIAMELLRGEDLRSRIRRMGRLSLATTAGLLVQVGKGLRRAHEAGIVHRDIKPGNLFLARVDDDEVLKVLDFGIAKEPDSKLDDHTRTGELIGSPHYVSPEQARGERDVDHRSDVWSLGVITFRMVTGELPFPGDGLGKVLSKVLVDPPPQVGSIVPGLPASLDVFFTRALAKKREERFGSVRELVDAFVVLAQSEESEDSVAPPSWSTIVNVSIPPPAPLPAEALVHGVDGNVPVAPLAAIKVPVASPAVEDFAVSQATPAKVPVVSPARAGAPEMGEAESAGPAEDEAAPESRSGKRDSLMPSMGPNLSTRRPLVRLRWVAVAALTLSTALTVGVAWWRDRTDAVPGVPAPHGAAGLSPGPAESLPGPDLPPPPPANAAPLPSSQPSVPGSTTMTAKATSAPAPSSAPSSRPVGSSAPAGSSAPGTRRKWGF